MDIREQSEGGRKIIACVCSAYQLLWIKNYFTEEDVHKAQRKEELKMGQEQLQGCAFPATSLSRHDYIKLRFWNEPGDLE